MRVAIIDYGCGNLHSLAKAIRRSGADPVITSNSSEALACNALFLPGVGAFGSASASLSVSASELRSALLDGMPCLGICLGMQLLFDRSDEGPGRGLGVIEGVVRRLEATRVPHMGWNTLDDVADTALFPNSLDTAYFANSYVCEPIDSTVVTAWTTHETDRFPAAVRLRNIVGVQFHPEKSSAPGLGLIRAFLDEVGR